MFCNVAPKSIEAEQTKNNQFGRTLTRIYEILYMSSVISSEQGLP
jgi:hypothetical protein